MRKPLIFTLPAVEITTASGVRRPWCSPDAWVVERASASSRTSQADSSAVSGPEASSCSSSMPSAHSQTMYETSASGTASSTRRNRESVARAAWRAVSMIDAARGLSGDRRWTSTERDSTWSTARQVTVEPRTLSCSSSR